MEEPRAKKIPTNDTLAYEQVDHTGHETIGEITDHTNVVEISGEVFANYGDNLIGFRSPEYSGIFIVTQSGRVEYSPHAPDRSQYIVGDNGQIK